MRTRKAIIVGSRVRVRKDGLQLLGPGLQVLLQPKWRCAQVRSPPAVTNSPVTSESSPARPVAPRGGGGADGAVRAEGRLDSATWRDRPTWAAPALSSYQPARAAGVTARDRSTDTGLSANCRRRPTTPIDAAARKLLETGLQCNDITSTTPG